MRATGWATIRVTSDGGPTRAAGLAGDGRARIRVDRRAVQAAPLSGARSFAAAWEEGRWRGEAVVGVIPLSSWGYELLVAAAPPSSPFGRLLWPRRRTARLAARLATAIAGPERPVRLASATRRVSSPRTGTAASGR